MRQFGCLMAFACGLGASVASAETPNFGVAPALTIWASAHGLHFRDQEDRRSAGMTLRWLAPHAIAPKYIVQRSTTAELGHLRYSEIAPGIDFDIYLVGNTIEYDLIVAPYTNPNTATLTLTGSDKIALDEQGRLTATKDDLTVTFSAPFAYQVTANGQRERVDSSYRLAGQYIGFTIGAYDPSRILVIDPLVVTRSTTVGGSANDDVAGIAVAHDGSVFLTGTTTSTDFMGTASAIGEDIYVIKINADSSIGYVQHIRGNGLDNALALDIDDAGNAFVLGYTDSTDLPTPNGFQSSAQGETDAYLFKLDPSGNLVYGSYYGGPDFDGQFDGGIAWHQSGKIYITSRSEDPGTGLPTVNAYESSCSAPPCILLAGFDTDQVGSASLIYASYAGGSGGEAGFDIAVDANGLIYLFGFTESATDLVVPGQGFQDTIGSIADRDHFLLKLNLANSGSDQLVYSTFIGGNGDEAEVGGFYVAPNGLAWITGNTTSTNIATNGTLQSTLGGNTDAYLIAVDTNISGAASRLWATYLGASGNETGWDIARAADGSLWLALASESPDLATLAPVLEFSDVGTAGPFDAVGLLANIAADGSSLIQLTSIAKTSTFLATHVAIFGNVLHASASVPKLAFLGNRSMPHPSGGRETYLSRFNLVPDLGLVLDVAAAYETIPVGDALSVHYAIRNQSLESKTGVTLAADFPSGATPSRIPVNCSFPTSQFTCAIPDLPPGDSHVVYIQAMHNTGNTLAFGASVTASESDANPGDNTDAALTAIQGNVATPGGAFTIEQFDLAAASANTGELLSNTRLGILASSQGVDASALNLLRLDGGIALPIDRIDNRGQVAFGLLDSTQWTPTDGDTLDLTQPANPAHRIFITLQFPGQITLWSAAPFGTPIAIADTLFDPLSQQPIILDLEPVTTRARVRQGAAVLLLANAFVSGGAQAGLLGSDQVVSLGFGPDFLGATILGPTAISILFADSFE